MTFCFFPQYTKIGLPDVAMWRCLDVAMFRCGDIQFHLIRCPLSPPSLLQLAGWNFHEHVVKQISKITSKKNFGISESKFKNFGKFEKYGIMDTDILNFTGKYSDVIVKIIEIDFREFAYRNSIIILMIPLSKLVSLIHKFSGTFFSNIHQ